jgi:hypothetical protein
LISSSGASNPKREEKKRGKKVGMHPPKGPTRMQSKDGVLHRSVQQLKVRRFRLTEFLSHGERNERPHPIFFRNAEKDHREHQVLRIIQRAERYKKSGGVGF